MRIDFITSPTPEMMPDLTPRKMKVSRIIEMSEISSARPTFTPGRRSEMIIAIMSVPPELPPTVNINALPKAINSTAITRSTATTPVLKPPAPGRSPIRKVKPVVAALPKKVRSANRFPSIANAKIIRKTLSIEVSVEADSGMNLASTSDSPELPPNENACGNMKQQMLTA